MINAADADVVIVATPVDLARLITINKPALRVRYNLVETSGSPTLADVLKPTLAAATRAPTAIAGPVTRLTPRHKASGRLRRAADQY